MARRSALRAAAALCAAALTCCAALAAAAPAPAPARFVVAKAPPPPKAAQAPAPKAARAPTPARVAAVARAPPAPAPATAMTEEQSWTTGRSTFFSGPAAWKKRFEGKHEYGTLWSGACEYSNYPQDVPRSDADVPFPLDEVAAIGERNPDFRQGVCGRCYQVRCMTGVVKTDYNCSDCEEPVGFMQADIAPDWKDSQNRSFPGFPQARAPPFLGKVPYAYAQCWNESAPPIFVRTVDICPCAAGYSNACCAPAPHFDLSYYAFEKLAHPLYGMMTIQYRPVDCNTRQPLFNSSAPNATSAGVLGGAQGAVYASGPSPGWGWNLHRQTWANLSLADGGGRNVTCASLSPGGLMAFSCLRCRGVFGAEGVRVSMRAAQHVSGARVAGGAAPAALRVTVSHKPYGSSSSAQNETFCDAKPVVGGGDSFYRVSSWSDGFVQYKVPWADLRCEPRVARADANRIALENAGDSTVTFCVRELYV